MKAPLLLLLAFTFCHSASFNRDTVLVLTPGSKIREVRGTVPFLKKFHFRYYLTLSLPPGKNLTFRDFDFAGIRMNQPSGPFSHNETAIVDFLSVEKGAFLLGARFRSGDDSSRYADLRIPVVSGERVCVEKRVNISPEDSVEVECSYNGLSAGVLRGKSFLAPETCGLFFAPFPDTIPVVARLEGFYLDSARPGMVPGPPQGCSEKADSGRVVLWFTPGAEKFSQTHWRVFRKAAGEEPYFEELADESNPLERYVVRFQLDSGEYAWQARVRGGDGRFGAFSEKRSFAVSHPKPPCMEIRSAYLTDIKNRAPLKEIHSGTGYEVHVELDTLLPWKGLAYLIISLSSPDYPFGNPGNKGGRFKAASNYVFNISFYLENSVSIHVLEKSIENSYSSVQIPDSGVGLYTAPTEPLMMLDTTNRHFKLKMRLLDKARPGPWTLSAYCVSNPENSGNWRDERFSAIHKTLVSVLPPKGFPIGLLSIAAVVCVLLIAGGILFMRRQAKGGEVAITANVLTDYLEKNLHREEISRETVMAELKLSRASFYDLLDETGRGSLPMLLNELRLSKARQVLLDTDKTVSEVSYAVGFTDPGYFNKVFKKALGLTPAEFRDKNRLKS